LSRIKEAIFVFRLVFKPLLKLLDWLLLRQQLPLLP